MAQPMTSDLRRYDLARDADPGDDRKDRYPLFGLAAGEARTFEADRFERLRRLEEDVENG
jgi:hypothetical protein